MKLNDLKHNHSLTDLLKVLIFSILMLVPFLSVATRSLYVICNKNAFESYENQREVITKYETNEVNTLTDLVIGRVYTYTENENFEYECRIGIEDILINEDIETYNFRTIATGYDKTIRTNYSYNGTGNKSFTVIGMNTEFNMYTNINKINFIYGNTQYNTNVEAMIPLISKCNDLPIDFIENENGTLDNVFEYSIDRLAKSQYYNWTQNTAIYTGIETMTTQLGITGATIPILLTYWFMLTIIYVVIDIILKLFTALTHMLGNKTAK